MEASCKSGFAKSTSCILLKRSLRFDTIVLESSVRRASAASRRAVTTERGMQGEGGGGGGGGSSSKTKN